MVDLSRSHELRWENIREQRAPHKQERWYMCEGHKVTRHFDRHKILKESGQFAETDILVVHRPFGPAVLPSASHKNCVLSSWVSAMTMMARYIYGYLTAFCASEMSYF